MLVVLVAAVAEDLVIGSATGGIPWNVSRDKAHFRARTAGRWLLVGRHTYGEMIGWFEDRTPIVLTSDKSFRPSAPGHRVATTLAQALDIAHNSGASELVVCGGAGTYASALYMADKLVLTRIHTHVDGAADAPRFPDFKKAGNWRLVGAEDWPAEVGSPSARLEIYDRIRD